MFRKPTPSAEKGALADRVRRIKQTQQDQPQVERPSLCPPKVRAARQSVFRQGVLILGGGQRLSVAIRNLSDAGARVEFHVRTPLPAVVLLVEPTLNLRRKARVVWQDVGAAGLEFV